MAVTLAAARRVALSFPGAVQAPHFDFESFRVRERKAPKSLRST